jgi:hypothetical protein
LISTATARGDVFIETVVLSFVRTQELNSRCWLDLQGCIGTLVITDQGSLEASAWVSPEEANGRTEKLF